MSGKTLRSDSIPGIEFIQKKRGVSEYRLRKNNLTILHKEFAGTGVVTSNILYFAGARDEQLGATGVAHMLEHMLFKPTTFDLEQNIDSGAMQFERETGIVLNANTWKDRTTYYFSYPKEHIDRALQIEAERMRHLVLTDKEFQPERANVLSEFDMYFGDPFFALELAIRGSAFHAHPYGHETLGFREDIESFTIEKLKWFYDEYYWPGNAVLMIVGDCTKHETLVKVKKYFAKIPKSPKKRWRHTISEPPQEGLRRIEIKRPSNTNILSVGIKHPGFPSKGWFETLMVFAVVANGPESILKRRFVDSGIATDISYVLEPTSEENIAILNIVLSKPKTHQSTEVELLKTLKSLKQKGVAKKLSQEVIGLITDDLYSRESSMKFVRELTEYTSSGDWTKMFSSEQHLNMMTPRNIIERIENLFDEKKLTIGYFIGE